MAAAFRNIVAHAGTRLVWPERLESKAEYARRMGRRLVSVTQECRWVWASRKTISNWEKPWVLGVRLSPGNSRNSRPVVTRVHHN